MRKKSPQMLAFSLLLAFGWGSGVARGAGAFEKPLPLPPESESLETLSRGVAAVFQEKGRVLLLPDAGSFGMSGPFVPTGTTREAVFGKLTDWSRLELSGVAASGTAGRTGDAPAWSGLDVVGDRALLLDGTGMAIVDADPSTLKELARRTLAWDLIKPPPDRGGEPTAPETAALRKLFKARVLATPGRKLVGMAPLPDAWQRDGARHYLLATRIPGFPLLQMECQREEPAACVITRQCFLEDAAALKPGAIVGLAVSASRRLVIIGDAERRRLVSFRYHSCFHVPRRSEQPLPETLKLLTNLAVDGDDRLWVSTATPDDFQNASLFYWPSAAW